MSTSLSGLNWLDVLFFAIFLGMLFKGLQTGVGRQIFSLIWYFALLYIVVTYYGTLSSELNRFISSAWAKPVSFFAIFASSLGFVKLLELILRAKAPESVSMMEKLGGMTVAAARAVILFGLIGMQLSLVPAASVRDVTIIGSRSAGFFMKIDAHVYGWMALYLPVKEKRTADDVLKNVTEGVF